MITVREVSSKRDQREFLNFPLRLYENEPNFVPPLYGDEKKIFRPDYIYYDTSEAVYFLAEEDGKTVGRISGILQKASNEKRGEKRIRFTRFDAVDRQEVADALFKAVEDWGRAKGMTEISGPLGFSDLEREGLLVEGFEYLATFEEQYNYPYYGRLIEGCGFVKEVDWTESRLKPDPACAGQIERLAAKYMERYRLHWGQAKNTSDFINKYGGKFFELIDKSYAKLYGTVDLTKGMKDMLISNFKLVIKLDYVGILLDENEAPVADAGEASVRHQPSEGHRPCTDRRRSRVGEPRCQRHHHRYAESYDGGEEHRIRGDEPESGGQSRDQQPLETLRPLSAQAPPQLRQEAVIGNAKYENARAERAFFMLQN